MKKNIKYIKYFAEFYRIFIFLFIILMLSGCAITTRNIKNGYTLESAKDIKITWIMLNNGKTFIFDSLGGRVVQRDTLRDGKKVAEKLVTGATAINKKIDIPIKEIYEFQTESVFFDVIKAFVVLLDLGAGFILFCFLALIGLFPFH